MRCRFWKAWLWVTLSTGASAHVISLSNGELYIDGRTAQYTLHMPAYEVEQLTNVKETLLREVRFGDGRLTASDCARESENVVCHATYEFDHDIPDKIEVECTLYRATVPNHIHMLYAVQGENADQRVFDQNNSIIEMRFHPPSLAESLTRDGSAGARRFLTSLSGILFLLVMALTTKSWRNAAALTAMFVFAEWLIRPMAAYLPLALSADFMEAVLALTAAYLAGEFLFLPEGRAEGFIVPVLGLLHGLPFTSFPAAFLVGGQLAQLAILFAFTVAMLRVPQSWRRPASAACFLLSLAWFARFVIA